MQKSTFTPHYEAFRKKLVAMRKAAKLNQRQLAKRLSREHSMVAKMEQGERRIDVVEFYWICKALKQDPKRAFAEVADMLSDQDSR